MSWRLKLINSIGEEIADELSWKEKITTKDIGKLNWELEDGDRLVLEYIEDKLLYSEKLITGFSKTDHYFD